MELIHVLRQHGETTRASFRALYREIWGEGGGGCVLANRRQPQTRKLGTSVGSIVKAVFHAVENIAFEGQMLDSDGVIDRAHANGKRGD